MIPTATASLRHVEALQHFADTYGVPMPADVVDARQAAIQMARDARLRQPFDVQAAARAALGTDVDKATKAIAKAATADTAEREALSALVNASAQHAAATAQAATRQVVEAATAGPAVQAAATDLAALLAGGHLPAVVGEDDPDAALVHARARRAEKVAEQVVERAAALPGFGGLAEFPVLMLFDVEPALERHARSTVRAAVRGINGSTDMGAFVSRLGSATPTYEPIYPMSTASVLLMRRGAAVRVVESLDELDARHALVTE